MAGRRAKLYWKGIIWLRIEQKRQMWIQRAEAFAQQRDPTAANDYCGYDVSVNEQVTGRNATN